MNSPPSSPLLFAVCATSACDAFFPALGRNVLCWLAFPSPGPSLHRLRHGSLRFVHRLPRYYDLARLPRPCFIGFDSSSSRCGPPVSVDGQTRDLQVPTRSLRA